MLGRSREGVYLSRGAGGLLQLAMARGPHVPQPGNFQSRHRARSPALLRQSGCPSVGRRRMGRPRPGSLECRESLHPPLREAAEQGPWEETARNRGVYLHPLKMAWPCESVWRRWIPGYQILQLRRSGWLAAAWGRFDLPTGAEAPHRRPLGYGPHCRVLPMLLSAV